MAIDAKDITMKVGAGGVITQPDNEPDPFTLVDQTNVPTSTLTESDPITVEGMDSFGSAAISTDIGEYQIDSGGWASTPGTVGGGSSIRLRHTSSALPVTSTNQVLTIGAQLDIFTTTTSGETQFRAPPRSAGYPQPKWNVPTYTGYDYINVTSITMNAIDVAETTGEAPFFLFASASNVTCTGTRTYLSSEPIRPYTMLEHQWTLTYDDDSPVELDQSDELISSRWEVHNPYTDYKGGEYTVPIRRPGTYKLTLTSRGPGISNSTTRTITVTAPTHDREYYDGLNGNDANDGFDPWGFNLSTATYTESTGELTQTGAFTSYNHTAATTGNYTDWYNWIYLISADSGPLGTWHRIASKTNNNTIVLQDKIGSDQTNVVSSDGAKQTFIGSSVHGSNDNKVVYLRGNQGATTYTWSQNFSFRTPNLGIIRTGLVGYDTNSDGVDITWNGSNVPVFNAPVNGSGRYSPAQVMFSNIHLNMNAIGGSNAPCIEWIVSSTSGSYTTNVCADRITIYNMARDRALQYLGQSSANPTILGSAWLCDFDGSQVASELKPSLIFLGVEDTSSRLAIVGVSATTACADLIRDHWVYPSFKDHTNFSYNYFYDGALVGYGFNLSLPNTSNTQVQYLTMIENFVAGGDWFSDCSPTNNEDNLGYLTDWIFARNCGYELRSGGIFGSAGFQLMALDNVAIFNITENQLTYFNPHRSDGSYTNADNVFSRNKIYGMGLAEIRNDNVNEMVNNEIHDYRTTASCIAYTESQYSSSTHAYDLNTFYTPNDAGTIIDNGAGDQTAAQFDVTTGGTSSTANPNWTDPANADFT